MHGRQVLLLESLDTGYLRAEDQQVDVMGTFVSDY
jgi:hypothetical protein